MGRNLILPLVAVFSVLFLVNIAFASTYLNVSVNPVVQPGAVINVTGSIGNTTTSDTISGINVTANTSSNWNYNVTPASGLFNISVTAPSTVGIYNLTIFTNSSSLINKAFTIQVANETASSSSVAYTGKFPPFVAGTTFTINITLKNGTTALQGVLPQVNVYAANGANQTTWTIVNDTNATDSNGLIQFNITVPSGASAGTYAIVVDNGALVSTFGVGSNYVVAVQSLSTSDEVSSFFSPSSTVNILAKVRDTSGTPVTGATVTAVVTYPNGTVSSSITLSAHPTTVGSYNNTFTDTSASGSYKIKITATISGSTVISNGIFNTQRFTASLQPQKNFFFEWGGQGSFKPNSTFIMDIVSINLTDGSTMIQSTCPASNYTLSDLSFANGTSVLNTVYAYSFLLTTTPSGSLCSIKLGNSTGASNLSTSGVYRARVNVTLGSESHVIEGFFSIQGVFLKATPVISLGGEDDFMQVVAPGSNLTISLKAVNTTDGTSITPQNITSFTVTSILPMQFTGGTNETTNVTQTSVNGDNPTSTDPTINMVIPSSMLGPLLIKLQATVSGQATTGNAFIVANYLMGGMSTQDISVGGGPGGAGAGSKEGGPQGGSGMLCSGTQTFNGMVQDAATNVAAQGATIVGVLQAREAESGKDVSSFLSIAGSTASSSSGTLTANVTFSPVSYSFSGDYFMILNATYKNVSAGVPGFFSCKNLNIGFPQITTIGSTSSMGFFVSPSSGLNLTLSNTTNMTGSLINTSSVLSVTKIFNFNPSTGSMKILVNNTPLQVTFTNTSSTMNATLLLYPQNFSAGGVALTQWPTGFFDVRVSLTAGVTGTTSLLSDTGHGGFMVVPFNAFPESFGFGSVSVGSVTSTIIDIQANGTYNTGVGGEWNSTYYSGANNTLVNISVGRPWEGDLTQLTGVNATLLSDGWNYTANSSSFSFGQGGPFERWNISYVIPTTVKKGFAMLTITVNASTNGTSGFGQVTVPLGLSVAKYNIVIPSQEGVGDQSNGSPFDGYGIQYNGTNDPRGNVSSTAFGSWNITFLAVNYSVNSVGGNVCVKNEFNSTRYGMGQPTKIPINVTDRLTKVMVIDRNTAGTYDTVVLNETSSSSPAGTIVILNSSQRNITAAGGTGGVYLWEIQNCGYFTVVNTTKNSLAPQGSFVQSYGGSHQKNTNFTIPYVIALGSASNPTFQSGAPISIKGVGQQNSGKNGGFGFTGKLTPGTGYIANSSTTDANGVAFITLNVTTSGNFVAFWNTTISGTQDAADFSSATFFEARAFNAYTNVVNGNGIYRVTLYNNASGTGAMASSTAAFNGTATTADGTLYVEYNTTDTKFAMNFNSPTTSTPGAPGSAQFTNQTYSLSGTNYLVAWITPNTTTGSTSANNQTILIYKSDNFQSGVINVRNATQNVTISVCGQTFAGNPPTPLTSMVVNNVTSQDWSQGGTVKTLTVYELMNNTNATGTDVKVGPGGCGLFNIGPGQLTSWPSASGFAPPVFANAYLTNGADSQQIYAANIFRTG